MPTTTKEQQQQQHRTVVRSRRSSEGTSGSSNSNHTNSKKTIRVIAPATLPEGYTFDVDIAGQAVCVTVPRGGVEKGEEFEFMLPSSKKTSNRKDNRKSSTSTNSSKSQQQSGKEKEFTDNTGEELELKPTTSNGSDDAETHDTLGAPYGRWRHHLCGCCDVFTQATFWMACCCAPVLIAQILTRLGLSWKGTKASPEEASLTFNRIVMSFIGILVVGNIPVIGYMVTFLYTVGLLAWTGRNLRRTVRQRYHIPASVHEKVDDCLCMMCCGCCSVIQMARHTHDDKEYPGSCCTTSGLDLDAPHIV